MNGLGTPQRRELPMSLSTSGWVEGNLGENRVIALLASEGIQPGFTTVSAVLDCRQQYRVGPYVLDFAWPKLRIGLEADGGVHKTGTRYDSDRVRDAWLRGQGWLMFRVDTTSGGGLHAQVKRVLTVVRALARS